MSYPNYPNQQQGYPAAQAGYAGYPPNQSFPNYGGGNLPPAYSPEDGQIDFDNAFSDKSIRQGFIRKVYSILSLQLLISFGSVILFTQRLVFSQA